MAFIRNTDKFIEGSKLFFSNERAKAAVQSDLDQLSSEDSAIKLRLDVIEGSGAGSISKAQADAQAYADQKVAALVNSAPSVLDTLKELADAIGGDQNFAATVAGQIGAVDAKVDQEILDRQAADSALSLRLDVLEADPVTKSYVDTEVQSAKDWASLLRDETEGYINSEVQNLVTTISENKAEFDFAYDELVSISNGIHHQLLAEITSRQNGDNALDARLDIIEGADTVSGSVAKALKDAKAYADSADALLNGRIDQEVSDRQSETATLGEEVAALWEQSNSANARIIALEADPVTKTYVDGQVSGLQSQVDTEKGRIDAILSAADADKDSFAEIVQLINSVDTSNDSAFASYVLSNDAALAQEVSDRQAGDDALSGRLDVLETDPVTKSYVDAEVSAARDWAGVLRDETENYINSEVQNLVNADVALGTRIDGVEAAIVAGDAALQAQLDAASSVVVANSLVKRDGSGQSDFNIIYLYPESEGPNPSRYGYVDDNEMGMWDSSANTMAALRHTHLRIMEPGKDSMLTPGVLKLRVGTDPSMPVAPEDVTVKSYVDAADAVIDAKIGSLESLGGKTDELWTNNMQTFMNVLQNDVVVYVPHNSPQAAHLMSRVGGSTFKMTVAFQGQELEFGPYALRGTPYLNNIFLGENVTIPLENITAPTLIFQEILNGFGVTFDPEIGVAGYNFVLIRFDTYANTPADLASGLVYERNVRTASDNQIQSSIQALKATDTYVLGDLTSLWGEIDYIYGSDGVVQGLSQEVSNRQAADSALSLRLDALEADPTTKTYVDGQVSGLQGQIDTEKGRIDAILSAADADKDSFAEIVQLINSIDTSNDSAFASYVLSNDAALAQEVSDRQAGDSALSGRLDALESDPTTKSYVDSKVSLLQAEDETFFKLDGSRPMTGGMRVKHVEKSANYTLTGSDYIVGVTSVAGGKVMTLPSAATMGAGKMFVIKDQSGGASVTNYIRIACQSGEQIDGQSSYDLDAPYESVTVVSNGTHWFIM